MTDQLRAREAGHGTGTYMAADFVPSSYPKDAVVADPDQPMISASPASAQCVVSPGVIGCIAVGCAVRWLAECWPDPHNCEHDDDEDRDHNLAPHSATVATADVPMVTAMWQFSSRVRESRSCSTVGIRPSA